MKRHIAIFIINLIALLLFIISLSTTYHNVKHFDKSDIVTGTVTKVNLVSNYNKGGTLHGFEYEINNNKNVLYLTPYERLSYTINIGDKIVSKNLYAGNTNSKILIVNGEKINSYYGIFDFLMLMVVVAVPLMYLFYFRIMNKRKYKNRTEEYKLMYNRKRHPQK
ncbi:hypothetical protein NU08_3891 [Flavobacterium anhuiense]|uniref:Uncharacterized protein n=1 Tax=Flavobacterium anhuiense TaxID=459526 RepID=A0A444VU14_9FLAO|nr:hypothetical protein [Flavobacterium anhuiense]RYJ37137.1 hypothetical protein NU08_3891 [Flavobacterium anhuiense]